MSVEYREWLSNEPEVIAMSDGLNAVLRYEYRVVSGRGIPLSGRYETPDAALRGARAYIAPGDGFKVQRRLVPEWEDVPDE